MEIHELLWEELDPIWRTKKLKTGKKYRVKSREQLALISMYGTTHDNVIRGPRDSMGSEMLDLCGTDIELDVIRGQYGRRKRLNWYPWMFSWPEEKKVFSKTNTTMKEYAIRRELDD